MLNKPFDFDLVTGYGEFRNITVGGHIMKIMSVEVVQSRENKEMLKISLDTAYDGSSQDKAIICWIGSEVSIDKEVLDALLDTLFADAVDECEYNS